MAAEQLKLVIPPHVGGEGGGDGLSAIWKRAGSGSLIWQFHQRFEGGEESGEQICERVVGENVGSRSGKRGRTRDENLNIAEVRGGERADYSNLRG